MTPSRTRWTPAALVAALTVFACGGAHRSQAGVSPEPKLARQDDISAIAKAKADSEEILAAAQAEWTELNASVPPLVDAIQGRVDTLTKSRKLPKDVDKATFETIKTDFETVKTDWTSATQEFTAGAAADAVRKGRAARAKAEEIQAKLGMNS